MPTRRSRVLLLLLVPAVALGLAAYFLWDYVHAPSDYGAAIGSMFAFFVFAALALEGLILLPWRRMRRVGLGLLATGAAFFALYLGGIAAVDHLGLARRQPPAPPVRVGPEVPASLVVYYRPGTPSDAIERFLETVLNAPELPGYGTPMVPGLCGRARVQGTLDGQPRDATALTFCPDSTPARREELTAAVRRSPIVEQALPDTRPDQGRSPR